MLPGVRFVVGHGQMPEGSLEKVMIAFADGAADVLVCTTIIESGLDIPNANTIVIDRADTLGLAQLYQLRGRVGRSSRRAYAYLLYRRRERLSDEARKRLQAIFNASELGAGFQIALSDLEIRGAGNILGGEQSGHMAAVGFDLYSRLLAEAVESRKASMEGRAPIVEAPQAVVDLPVEAHLPDEYVPDEAQKLELYRRLARARSTGDLAAFRQEVLDRYGPMPDPVDPAHRGGRAAPDRRGGGRRLDLARGGLARRAVRRRTHPRDRHAAAGRPVAARAAPVRRDVRQQPGPDAPAGRPAQGLDVDPGRGRAAVRIGLTARAAPTASGLASWAYRHPQDRTPPRRCPMRSYLVVGNQTLAGPELASVIEEVMAQDGETAFHVVVPATPNQRGLTWDEDEARAEAGRRLDAFMDRLRGLGAEVSGEIGSRDPIEAVQDALRGHPCDEIILSTLPSGISRWLGQDVPTRLRGSVLIPVRVVTAARESVEAAG